MKKNNLRSSCSPQTTLRILADGVFMNNNTHETGINNNDLIFGPSGAGKTRSYVMPNIMQANESMVIADTKGNLKEQMQALLKERGYTVLQIDFKSMNSTCRWNPLEYISYDKKRERYSERDIAKIAKALTPSQSFLEPFWDNAASEYLCLLISYVMDFLPEEEHTLEYVLQLFNIMDTSDFDILMQEVCNEAPTSTAAKYWAQIKDNKTAERTHECIKMFVSEHLSGVSYDAALAMYSHPYAFRFEDLGRTKTALFVNISDTDRSMDPLVSLFYTQILQSLCDYADRECKDQRLPIPVRLILDDFATNIKIEDFDKTISVIRSRDIYVSVILQSISQLTGLYGPDRANTIIDNCDNILYLGGQSIDTAKYIATRADIPECLVLNMPLEEAWLFTRGQLPRKVRKFDIHCHCRYSELPEAQSNLPVKDVTDDNMELEPAGGI